jgi:hypothetical protein
MDLGNADHPFSFWSDSDSEDCAATARKLDGVTAGRLDDQLLLGAGASLDVDDSRADAASDGDSGQSAARGAETLDEGAAWGGPVALTTEHFVSGATAYAAAVAGVADDAAAAESTAPAPLATSDALGAAQQDGNSPPERDSPLPLLHGAPIAAEHAAARRDGVSAVVGSSAARSAALSDAAARGANAANASKGPAPTAAKLSQPATTAALVKLFADILGNEALAAAVVHAAQALSGPDLRALRADLLRNDLLRCQVVSGDLSPRDLVAMDATKRQTAAQAAADAKTAALAARLADTTFLECAAAARRLDIDIRKGRDVVPVIAGKPAPALPLSPAPADAAAGDACALGVCPSNMFSPPAPPVTTWPAVYNTAVYQHDDAPDAPDLATLDVAAPPELFASPAPALRLDSPAPTSAPTPAPAAPAAPEVATAPRDELAAAEKAARDVQRTVQLAFVPPTATPADVRAAVYTALAVDSVDGVRLFQDSDVEHVAPTFYFADILMRNPHIAARLRASRVKVCGVDVMVLPAGLPRPGGKRVRFADAHPEPQLKRARAAPMPPMLMQPAMPPADPRRMGNAFGGWGLVCVGCKNVFLEPLAQALHGPACNACILAAVAAQVQQAAAVNAHAELPSREPAPAPPPPPVSQPAAPLAVTLWKNAKTSGYRNADHCNAMLYPCGAAAAPVLLAEQLDVTKRCLPWSVVETLSVAMKRSQVLHAWDVLPDADAYDARLRAFSAGLAGSGSADKTVGVVRYGLAHEDDRLYLFPLADAAKPRILLGLPLVPPPGAVMLAVHVAAPPMPAR